MDSGEVTAERRKPAFANWFDLDDVANNFTLLAIVFYAQVFNRGSGSIDSDKVVAHANAAMFGISIREETAVSRTHATVLDIVDLKAFKEVTQALLHAVQTRMQGLRVRNSGWVR